MYSLRLQDNKRKRITNVRCMVLTNNNLNKRTPEKQPELTIQTDNVAPNPKVIAGDSVNKHKDLEVANALIAGGEIGQQNENL